ncbi:unnamed protein product [Withania somnifera]
MDITRLKFPKTIAIFSHIKCPSTCVIYTSFSDKLNEPLKQTPSSNKPNPITETKQRKGFDLNLRKWITSFDAILLEIQSSSKPLNVLKNFHVASGSCGFTRLLLTRLIDGKLPALFDGKQEKYAEVAVCLAELSSVSDFGVAVRTFDLLVHLCCTQFKNVGFDAALDVFRSLASRGLHPSLDTCNFLLSSLVKENELWKSYEVFGVLKDGVKPDVYLFRKVDEAEELFQKMKNMGIVPNVVTYNNFINGLCKNCKLVDAFLLKEETILNGVNPSIVTYSMFINCLMKLEKFDEADCVLKEMSNKGLVPNEVLYNTIINAVKVRDEMLKRGIFPNSVTCNSLIKGFCKVNQASQAEKLLEEMLLHGLSVNPGSFSNVILVLCMNSSFVAALRFVKEMVLRCLRPNDGLLTTLISGLCKEGKHSEAVELWHMLLMKGLTANTEAVRLLKAMLQSGVQIDSMTYNALIYAFCKEGNLDGAFMLGEKGKIDEALLLWDECQSKGLVCDIYTYGALINGLCKADKLEKGRDLFHEMLRQGLAPNLILYDDMKNRGILPNVVTYSSLIHGMSSIRLTEDEGVPSNVVCYTALIRGYCKLGQMDKARSILQEMLSHDIQPNKITYTVIIDGYCQAGKVKEAKEYFAEMVQKGNIPDSVTYNVLT